MPDATHEPTPEELRDLGVITAVEMLYLLVFGLVALLFFTYLGRLHAAAIQVENTSQAAARAASQAAGEAEAEDAAGSMIDSSPLAARCTGELSSAVAWTPSPSGDWQGGSVTVTISCTFDNEELTGIWSPGARTISAADTQPIDRYQR